MELGKRLRQICKEKDILFIVNDDVELAKTLQADGIHVGQEDMPVDEVRERFPDKIVGLSVANMEEVKRSRLDLVDYVGAGPIFATPTKPDDQPSGYDWLKEIRTLHPNVSIVAIGGIKPENAQTVLKAGAECHIEGIDSSDDIHQDVNYRVVFEHKGATYVIECLGEAVEEMFEIA